jgi:hypothetical protein
LPNGHIRTAIPNFGVPEQHGTVELFDVAPGTSPELLGTVEADFTGLPRFSPDGEHILYITDSHNTSEGITSVLMIANADGSDPVEYLSQRVLGPSLRWTPQSDRFLCAIRTAENDNELWIGALGQPPERFPAPGVLVGALVWADEKTFVYRTPREDGSYTFFYATIDEPDQATQILIVESYPRFSALRP